MKKTVAATGKKPPLSFSLRLLILLLALLAVLSAGYGIFAAIAGPQGFFLRQTAVLTTKNYTVDGSMMAYYYYDLYHALLEEEGEALLEEGLDPQKPLTEQLREDGQSWYDYFMTDALDYVRRILIFAEAARAAGDPISACREEVSATLDALREKAEGENLSLAAYITENYGQGVTEEDVRRAVELSAYAYRRYGELLATVYSEEELEAAYQKDKSAYRRVDYILYKIKADVPTDASESEMREAFLAAEQTAQKLAAAESADAFADALAELLREEDPDRKSYEISHLVSDCHVYHATPTGDSELSLWLKDTRRRAGESAVLGQNGDYEIVYFLAGHERLDYHRVSMRHILLAYGDYTLVSEARQAAEKLLADFLAGEASEENFAALVPQFSADAATLATGGLYTDIGYGSLEKRLGDWLLTPVRKSGDTAVLQSAYGFHVVYFVGKNDRLAWQEDAALALQEETYMRYLAEANLRIHNSNLHCLPSVTVAV